MGCSACGSKSQLRYRGASGVADADLGWLTSPDGVPYDTSNPIVLTGDPSKDMVIAQVTANRRPPVVPPELDRQDIVPGVRVALVAKERHIGLFGWLQIVGTIGSNGAVGPAPFVSDTKDNGGWVTDAKTWHPGFSTV